MSHSSPQDRAAVERAVADLIRGLGLDSRLDPELDRTPARIAEFYAEAFAGLAPGSEPELQTFPHEPGRGGDDLVAVRDLAFHSICVHHFAPFFGRASILYVPHERIVGISGPARLLDWYARRPQLQERLTTQLADHLQRLLAPRGLAVVLSARHLCMEMRGIRRRGRIETAAVRGVLAEPRWSAALGQRRP